MRDTPVGVVFDAKKSEPEWQEAYALDAQTVSAEDMATLDAHVLRLAFGAASPEIAAADLPLIRQSILDAASDEPSLTAWAEPRVAGISDVVTLQAFAKLVHDVRTKLAEIAFVRDNSGGPQ